MDAFIAQAKALVKTADEAGRKKILDTLREVSYSLESPQDSAQRIMYLVRSFLLCPLRCANIRTATPGPIGPYRLRSQAL